MTAAPAPILDTQRFVRRLRDAGMADGQAHALGRLLADVRLPGFDREIAYQDLVGAGFTHQQAEILIEETVLASGRDGGQGRR